MLAWNEIEGALSPRWSVVGRGASWLSIRLLLERREQKVIVALAGGAIVVLAEVCRADQLDGAAALAYNATAEHGELALVHGMLALRRRLSLERLTLEALERAIHAGSVEASLLARRTLRPAPTQEAFASAYAGFLD